MARWASDGEILLPLRSPIDVALTVASHGWASLAPWQWNPEAGVLSRGERIGGRFGTISVAQHDLATIVIRRDGVAVAACMYIDAPAEGITLSKGLGTRHWSAAAVSRKTKAIAVTVSQSSGTVRLFLNGEVVLHIEPLARPMIWQHFKMETQETEGTVLGG